MELCCGKVPGQGNRPISQFCEPLVRLYQEHSPLNEMKQDLYERAKQTSSSTDPRNHLLQLREKVLSFQRALDQHSRREEDGLFEMMTAHIGKELGPIAMMEYEHSLANENIRLFLEQTSLMSDKLTKEEALGFAQYIVTAYEVLTSHFMKEESVLFPMAEQMLSDEEKRLLAERMETI
ncbi:hemerythrin-like domain-containing protein [Oikeobacillus pervagus]|uniref:Hemerythrin-like domain-containing protein n=1 Tax=Oikeobacillus pervagus TaxID=1325931 RepID=A0AAJ1WHP8_9BACI|nr:hemerythrin domain-containing protein [Oikeobacillus pervagus]MDQ0216437.1 hemerythrin-like domain-containing protein [Oikeobacillus pervagus]